MEQRNDELEIVKKLCSFPVLLDEPGNFCYNRIRKRE